ncbi:ribosome biogenesis factor YjgA [Actinobacillus porcinus]|uniref:Dual-action ribosomal maturation protein DarP n=1 Tax=Actinobacillus porcinus TaxID=51048 RepID=A0ABY6TN36_9PAST|nr:ribosome biogenesis factor YjgA [Actinobacillus porcinus]MCI5763264.1 ribosome-associated protein [Actinobacillus porcinus]MDY5421868.1 ribosome biogenesis factor YjgA [Actinobacillus porcinus]MDY5847509.1 ribosome biogenesis factor YjgA [Actinobacillus porcinus]MDY6215503.1 ribosome biogenesis factor YjgA [Actinobacillus porcinus]VFY93825.1 x96 protein [Actinobacillus porcinus]
MKKRGKKPELDWTDDEQEEIIWVSKSEIKRDAEELKKLGSKLVELTQTNLDKIQLDETLLDAINLARRSRLEAKRRQLQFIGKLLRSATEEEINHIRESLDKIENKHNQQQAMLHKLELLRDELVEQGDDALAKLLDEHPDADRQHLRNLIRSAQKEKAQNKPPKAYRDIYQYLKTLILQD